MSDALTVEKQLAELTAQVEALRALDERALAERDEYRKLYLEMLEQCRKLEFGILGQKRERLCDDDAQLSLSMLSMLLEIEPWSYLRDLLCLIPSWPHHRVLELAPGQETLKHEDTQQRLAANIFRQATLAQAEDHRLRGSTAPSPGHDAFR